LLISTKLLE